MVDCLDSKQKAELDYWICLSKELTAGCTTDAEKREALQRVCTDITFPRYLQSLCLTENSFAGMKVLDLGCGPHGGLIGFKDCERYGADHLIEGYCSIGYPLEKHGIAYVNCKAENLPFTDGFFDTVVCINALDHVDDLGKTISEISRVLRRGGRFIGQFNFHARPTRTEPICLTHHTIISLCGLNQLRLEKREFQCRMHDMHEDRYLYQFGKVLPAIVCESLVSAESFLVHCIRDGLAHSLDTANGQWVKPYPEVTGYLISYFSQDRPEYAIPKIIIKAAKKLLRVQHENGGFPSFFEKNRLFTFDSSQIMHGLACLYLSTGDECFLKAAIRAADFVCSMQLYDGSMFPVYDLSREAMYVERRGEWGISFSTIQVKNIEGLLLIYKLTGNKRYAAAADKLVAFGKRNCDLAYTHPGAYCLEGLLAAGEAEFVRERLDAEIVPRLQSNGFLAYAPHLPYAYVSGSVQMGILLHKTGFKDEARRILAWATVVQKRHTCRGLFQYADASGEPDNHVHMEINSWGTKYFCQLERACSCGL